MQKIRFCLYKNTKNPYKSVQVFWKCQMSVHVRINPYTWEPCCERNYLSTTSSAKLVAATSVSHLKVLQGYDMLLTITWWEREWLLLTFESRTNIIGKEISVMNAILNK